MPQAALVVLDPGNTTGWITRNHGLMVFDQLYGMDAQFRPQPQMAAGHVIEDDGRTWRISLRDGLTWHDGERVTARDCVASIRRWAKRDGLGNTLMAATEELSAAGEKVIVFRLKKPFPMLAAALAKVPTYCCFMMPERLANSDPFRPLSEMVGSGPFRFKMDEFDTGIRSVYQRFDGYRPREQGVPEWTAGPKVVNVDRVEWTVVPDPATAASALRNREQDWWDFAATDLLDMLRRDRNIKVDVLDPTGGVNFMRPNSLQRPFSDPGVRRAVMAGISQSSFMESMASDPDMYHVPLGTFTPGTSMASNKGLPGTLEKGDLTLAKKLLKESGYAGETVVLMAPTDYVHLTAQAEVMADLMRQMGMKVDYLPTEFGAMLQRRSNPGPTAKGGWSAVIMGQSGTDWLNPAYHSLLRAEGNQPSMVPGWPDIPELERLRSAWFDAPTEADQAGICADMQEVAMRELPFLPLGQRFQATAYTSRLSGVVKGLPVFWNVKLDR